METGPGALALVFMNAGIIFVHPSTQAIQVISAKVPVA